MTAWQTYLNNHQSLYLNELIEFLRIPSISSLPEHKPDVQNAADWAAERIQTTGLDHVRILKAGDYPLVYGDWLKAPGKPTILIYGHMDVQPVDPLDLWTHPPFDPTVQNGRIYARGASDDKGNMFIPIIAVESILNTAGALPVNLKFLFEGEEEIGSPHLPGFMTDNRDLLACDLVLSADGEQWEADQPALHIGLRGIVAFQIDIKNAAHDVHSGTYGGTFMNSATALARLISSMHSADGKVLIKGFYDQVRTLSDKERKQIAEVPYNESGYKKELGIDALFGEPGYTTYERAWTRPTLEVNGIYGGFQDEGVKTVIPSSAHAKISCRLVPDQDPERIQQLVSEHIRTHTPKGIKVSIHPEASGAYPYVIAPDHPGNKAAHSVLKTIYGKEPYYTRMGGSIPFCSLMKNILGANTVIFAFGLKDENVHAPDEFFRLSSFERGQRAYGLILEELVKYDNF